MQYSIKRWPEFKILEVLEDGIQIKVFGDSTNVDEVVRFFVKLLNSNEEVNDF